MRAIFLLLLSAPLSAQFRLYTCVVTSRGYVVGAPLPPSGIFRKPAAGAWEHVGYPHPFLSALDYDPRDPSALYLAAGNGLIHAADRGRTWKILTSYDVTELRDLAVDRNAPNTIYFSHTAGIRVTRDGGNTWQPADRGIRHKYTEALRVDRTQAGHLVAGTEDGIFYSADAGNSWTRAGAAGWQVLRVEQSPHDACRWLAVTQAGGVFQSSDCGRSFENQGRTGVDRNLYDVAFDPYTAARIALAGWSVGVLLSADGGKTWQPRNAGLPRPDVWSVTFDPTQPNRIYAGVHEEALFVSDDLGATWRKDGLEGSVIRRMTWVPETVR
jgi:hypothetical protein